MLCIVSLKRPFCYATTKTMKPENRPLRFKDIHISSPCKESWHGMDQITGGRFCGRCQKSVFDMTNATEEELNALVAEHGHNFCGRFRLGQISLQAPTTKAPKRSVSEFFKKAAAIGVTLAFLTSAEAESGPDDKPEMEWVATGDKTGEPDKKNTLVTGIVLDVTERNLEDDIEVELIIPGKKPIILKTTQGLFHTDLKGIASPETTITVKVRKQEFGKDHRKRTYFPGTYEIKVAEGQNHLVRIKTHGLYWDEMIMGDIG